MIEPPSTTARYAARSGLSLIIPCMEVPRVPTMAPVAARAPDQASSAPRCRRQATPAGLRSDQAARVGPSLVGSMPPPKSRRSASRTATPISATVRSIGNASGHRRFSVGMCVAWTQPIGLSHTVQSARTSQTARIT